MELDIGSQFYMLRLLAISTTNHLCCLIETEGWGERGVTSSSSDGPPNTGKFW